MLVSVQFHGWFFTDEDREMSNLMEKVTDRVSDEAHDRIQERFDAVLKNPTGHLASRVSIERRTRSEFVVTDGGVIYGPWIEGTGSRNSTTRFKGYHTYREVAQRLEADAQDIAEEVIRRELPR